MIGSLARFVGVVISRSISFGLNSYYTHPKTANRLNWAPSRRCIWKNRGRSDASIYWACKVKFMNGWLSSQEPRWTSYLNELFFHSPFIDNFHWNYAKRDSFFTKVTKSRYKGQGRRSFEGNSTAERVGSYRLSHYLWCWSDRYLWK